MYVTILRVASSSRWKYMHELKILDHPESIEQEIDLGFIRQDVYLSFGSHIPVRNIVLPAVCCLPSATF